MASDSWYTCLHSSSGAVWHRTPTSWPTPENTLVIKQNIITALTKEWTILTVDILMLYTLCTRCAGSFVRHLSHHTQNVTVDLLLAPRNRHKKNCLWSYGNWISVHLFILVCSLTIVFEIRYSVFFSTSHNSPPRRHSGTSALAPLAWQIKSLRSLT